MEFIGVDGLLGGGLGVEAVAQGKLDASFYYPTGGGVAIKVAWQILSGQAYTKKYALSTAMIDKTNAGYPLFTIRPVGRISTPDRETACEFVAIALEI